MSKPISPSDIPSYKAVSFPNYVFDAFNELIAINFSDGTADILQKDVVALMLQKANVGIDPDESFGGYNAGLTKGQILSLGYLNVEEVYRAQGWKVSYDKPGYNESYDALFRFTAK